MDEARRELLGAQLRERALKWRAFNRWKELNRPPARPPAEILADLDWLRSISCPSDQAHDDDPRKTGVVRMKRTLALLKARR